MPGCCGVLATRVVGVEWRIFMCVMRGAGNTGERWRHGRAGIQECDGQVRGGAELIWSGCVGRRALVGVRDAQEGANGAGLVLWTGHSA